MKLITDFRASKKSPIAGYVTKMFILVIDLLFALFAIFAALLITNKFNVDRANTFLFSWLPIIILGLRAGAFILFRTYLIIIRYVGEKDYKNIFYAVSSSTLVLWLILKFGNSSLPQDDILPVVIVDYLMLLILSGGLRILLRLVFDQLRMQSSSRLNTVIFGAGEMGAILERVLKHNVSHNYRVVAFFDDNPKVHKKFLNGIRIFSPRKSFADVVKRYDIKVAIIGINHLSEERRIEFIDNCLTHRVKVLKVPPPESWINDTVQVGLFKDINFEDLLNRPPIKLNELGITSSINGKVVLVTGCAGSIGSEIVRQLLKYEPSLIIGLDQAETPLSDITFALKSQIEQGKFISIIGDVTDQAKIKKVFVRYQPDYVFHAAAYKHVPIMEHFPEEAVKVNIQGTKTVADLAVAFKVKKFVMISTDKVVNPSNVMGASKRIAEIYVQSLNFSKGNSTQFITTRFGNVLGSNGSVIPIFKSQIENRLPVTVTHPEVTRFFMTIPEACQLVLEAGTMGNGGEIFIFDMGEPVKIYDLATKMIQLAGFRPEKDIKIVFTGLRPGEKLYEELLDEQEDALPTYHPKIRKASVRPNEFEEISLKIDALIEEAQKHQSIEDLVSKMKDIVPEFSSQNSVFSVLDRQKDSISH